MTLSIIECQVSTNTNIRQELSFMKTLLFLSQKTIAFPILTWCFLFYKLTHRAVGHHLLWPLQLEAWASWCSLDGLTSAGVNSDFIYDQRHQTHVTGICSKVDFPPLSEFENFSGILELKCIASSRLVACENYYLEDDTWRTKRGCKLESSFGFEDQAEGILRAGCWEHDWSMKFDKMLTPLRVFSEQTHPLC